MRTYFLTGSIFLVSLAAFSQSDFREGYVVTNAGDTIFGLVDYREGFKPNHTCAFKASDNSDVISYEPDHIVSYGFTRDKFFESRRIKLPGEPEKAVFLEVLVRGIVTLYKFERTFWIEKNGHQFQQLTNETEEGYANGIRVIKSTNRHIGVLNSFMFDCPKLRNRIYKIRLVEKEITKLVNDYHQCKGTPAVNYKSEKRWITATAGVTAGLNVSNIRFRSGLPGYRHLLRSFEPAVSPAFGLSLDVVAPRTSERFSFHLSPSYMSTNYRYIRSFHNFGTSSVKESVSIDIDLVQLPAGIRYTFPERKITPYINTGLSYILHLTSGSKWTQEVITTDNKLQTTTRQALPIRDRQLGIWVGVGGKKRFQNKLSLSGEIRCEQTNGIVPFRVDEAYLRAKVTNIRLIFGLQF